MTTYRQWLQNLVNSGGAGLPGQEASALLQVVGDDFGVNEGFINDPYAYTNSDRGQVFSSNNESGQNTGYGPQGIQRLNEIYSSKYNDKFNAPSSGSVLGVSTGGSGSGSTIDLQAQADEQAYWADQLKNADKQIGRLDKQRSTGRSNIESAFSSANKGLDDNEALTERDYNTRRGQTIDDNISAKNDVDTSVRNTNQGLQRLLGAAGAGNSSAASIMAPYAAAVQGSQQRGQVNKAFERNIGSLDTSFGDFQKELEDERESLITQRDNSFTDLDSSIKQTRADLLSQKGDAEVQRRIAGGERYSSARAGRASYLDRIDELIGQIDSLGKRPTFTSNTPTFEAPELSQYTFDRAGVPTRGQSPGAVQNAGAYYTLLGANDEERKRR